MAIKPLTADVAVHQKLGDNPGIDDGLTPEELKKKWDEAAEIIKDYINNHLIPELDQLVDVEALLNGILDQTLSKEDKAAQAKAVGEAFYGMRSFFANAIHSGDYVRNTGDKFAAEVAGISSVKVKPGSGVILGNDFSLPESTVTLDTGSTGLNRNDLIVIRCVKGEDMTLSYNFEKITGTNTSGNASDPSYTQEDINGSGTTHDFPIYRVKFQNGSMTAVEPLFFPETVPIEMTYRNVTVQKAAFVANSTYQAAGFNYRAAIPLSGAKSSMDPDVVFGTADASSGNFSQVSETYDGGVYIYSQDVPQAAITVPRITLKREV